MNMTQISLFMMYFLEFFNILINIKKMKENNENYEQESLESETKKDIIKSNIINIETKITEDDIIKSNEDNNIINQINGEIGIKKEETIKNNDENNANQINKDKNNEINNSNIKYFSYGIFFSGLCTFFISGGINSFLFIILINLIINTCFFNFKEKNIQIQYFFIIFSYLILSLRANFIDLVYFINFCVEYWTILNKKYLYINLIINAFFLINFN